MSTSEKLVSPRGHFVQLYDATGRVLAKNVGRYLHEGLKKGDSLIVVATPDHTGLFCRALSDLGADPNSAVQNGLLVLLDAEEELAKFMVNGRPDWELFESTIGAAIKRLRPCLVDRGLRAYGEMVGVLWTKGQFSAAMELEEFWNTLLQSNDFSLFCAYPIDVFGKRFHSCDVDALLCSHSDFLPAEANEQLEQAIEQAMRDVLGPTALGSRDIINIDAQPSWATTLKAEALILWVRRNFRESADQILGRAQQYYCASLA